MSGELQIVFIYDTLRCRKEEDDPKDAILYFHPSDIAEERRICICGQLMGITHFLSDSFSSPQILTLENGKFALRRFGKQYILALGCSSITPDWLLEKQADILYSLTKFFHKDIQSILTKSNPISFLRNIMDHYIPVSQHHGDLFALTFGILPILYLPNNSANNICLQASLLLHSCMTKKGVLGGVVMHQNKVVGVEICQEIAQKLAFMQPYQLPPAEVVPLNFKIPAGVQIFTVYVSDRELKQLRRRAMQFQNPSSCQQGEGVNLAIGSIREDPEGSDIPSDVSSSIGFSEVSSSLYMEDASSRVSILPSSSSVEAHESGVTSMDDGDKSIKLNDKSKNQFILNNTSVTLNEVETNLGVHRFRSLQNISAAIVQEENLKKSLSSSLADPFFPYVFCNGKSISRCFFESVSNVATDEVNNGNDECLSDHENQQFPNFSPAVSPSPEPLKLETPPSINTVSTPSSIRRPINLPLNSMSLPEKPKSSRWSTLDDMMSPMNPPSFQPMTPVFQNFTDNMKENETHKKLHTEEFPSNIDDSYTDFELNDAAHFRMLNSFRKLSSHDDSGSSFQSSSENEKPSSSIRSSSSYKSALPSYTNFTKKETNVKSNASKDCKSREDEPYEKAYLYTYSYGSMRLLLLMDGDQPLELNVVQSLWEYGSIGVSELETSIYNVEEQGSTMEGQSDPYCYLRYETIWKTLAHGGNHCMDFDRVQLMHRDFTSNPNMSELIIRGDDHVVYGYQCVGSEVFYQQSANVLSGLPLSSDLMGKVPLKAKCYLERDHSIILL